ncbi:MAG: PAS domain S-box protein, partial [Myxococcota bacterium]
ELQRLSRYALEALAEGRSLAEVLAVIVDAVAFYPEAVSGIVLSQDGLRISSGDIPIELLEKVEQPVTLGRLELNHDRFAAVWREAILGTDHAPLGYFCLFKPSVKPFSEAEKDLCRTCAHLAGLAIERRRTQAILQEKEDELASLLDSVIEAIITVDDAGLIETVNVATQKMFQYSVDEMIGRNVSMLMGEYDATRHDQYMHNYMTTGEAKIIGIGREVKGRRKDGTLFPLELGVSEHRASGRRRFTGILRDITERKQAQAELQSSQRRLQNLMSNLPGMAYRCPFVEEEDELDFVSSGSLLLTGYAPEQLVGRRCLHDLVVSDDLERVVTLTSRAIERSEAFEVQYRLQTATGSTITVLDKGRMVEPEGFVEGFVIDVTDRDELEKQLRQSQKLEAVGTLAAGVAHDFNNLLMGIKGCVTLARDKVPDESPAQVFLREGAAAVERGAQLTRQLLAFSRQVPAERSPMSLSEVITRTDVIMKRLVARQHELLVDPGSPDPIVLADPAQLEQALLNLVVNARDAISGEGQIVVRTYSSKREGKAVGVLEVEDNGSGMDDQTRARIFEPFFTTKKDTGTGLGLASAYGIAEAHGGWFEVDSELGKGSTMRLVLPGRTE